MEKEAEKNANPNAGFFCAHLGLMTTYRLTADCYLQQTLICTPSLKGSCSDILWKSCLTLCSESIGWFVKAVCVINLLFSCLCCYISRCEIYFISESQSDRKILLSFSFPL